MHQIRSGKKLLPATELSPIYVGWSIQISSQGPFCSHWRAQHGVWWAL